jgi:hypothetical protein
MTKTTSIVTKEENDENSDKPATVTTISTTQSSPDGSDKPSTQTVTTISTQSDGNESGATRSSPVVSSPPSYAPSTKTVGSQHHKTIRKTIVRRIPKRLSNKTDGGVQLIHNADNPLKALFANSDIQPSVLIMVF